MGVRQHGWRPLVVHLVEGDRAGVYRRKRLQAGEQRSKVFIGQLAEATPRHGWQQRSARGYAAEFSLAYRSDEDGYIPASEAGFIWLSGEENPLLVFHNEFKA